MSWAFLQDFGPIGVLLLGAATCAALSRLPAGARHPSASRWVALGALLLAFAASIGFWRSSLGPTAPDIEHGSFLIDRFGLYFYVLALAGAGAALFCGADSEAQLDPNRGVYHLLLLMSTAGVLMVASSTDVVTMDSALALALLPLALAQGLRKTDLGSIRAAVRSLSAQAFALVAIASGSAILAGLAGSTGLLRIPVGLHSLDPLVVVGALLVLLGAALPLGLFPFLWWRSSQGQGLPAAPSLAATLLGWLAAAAALLRLLPGMLGAAPASWTMATAVLAAATLLLAPILALRQRRLLGAVLCLLPAQLALGLAGLLESSQAGVASVLYLLLCTVPLGAALLGWLAAAAAQGQGDGVADLRGLWGRSPLMAGGLGLLLCGLAGLPPMAGFFVRLLAASSALQAGMGWLAWAELLSAVLSALVVFRWLLRLLDPRVEGAELALPGLTARLGIVLCGGAVLSFGVLIGPLFAIASRAAFPPLVGP